MLDPGPKLMSIGLNVAKGDWHIDSHKHPNFQMIVVAQGHEDVKTPDGTVRAGVGDVLMFKPGVPHEEWSGAADPLRTYFMDFSWRGDTSGWPLLSVDAEGRLRLLGSWLYDCRDETAAGTREAEKAFFFAIVYEFVRLRRRQEDPMVNSIRGFVRQNIGTPLTVDLLARHAGLSKFHFIRRYRQLTGRSPMEDVRMIRVGHARDMILTSSLPLKAIAPLAGLGDEISLYRLFRRYLNMTPGHLRRTVRGAGGGRGREQPLK